MLHNRYFMQPFSVRGGQSFPSPVLNPVDLSTDLVAPTTCNLLLVLLLVCVTRIGADREFYVTRIGADREFLCYPYRRGKPHRITEACGNKLFKRSWRFVDLGD